MYDYESDSYEVEGVPVKIFYDELNVNPYKWHDCATELLVSSDLHRNYSLGEHHSLIDSRSSAVIQRYLTLCEGYVCALPFAFLDYGSSGSRIYITDTDTLDHADGFVVLSKEKADKQGITPEYYEQCVKNEFEEFRCYIEGEVFGFIVAEGTEDEESCWGFYGEKYCREEAAEVAKSIRVVRDHRAAELQKLRRKLAATRGRDVACTR